MEIFSNFPHNFTNIPFIRLFIKIDHIFFFKRYLIWMKEWYAISGPTIPCLQSERPFSSALTWLYFILLCNITNGGYLRESEYYITNIIFKTNRCNHLATYLKSFGIIYLRNYLPNFMRINFIFCYS